MTPEETLEERLAHAQHILQRLLYPILRADLLHSEVHQLVREAEAKLQCAQRLVARLEEA
jgi:hypothetical protein